MRRELSSSRMPLAVAVYRPEHYARLLATTEDASDLEPTWQEWHNVYQETRQHMAALGIDLIEVTVDLDDLEQYCQEQRLKNTSGTSAPYTTRVLSEQHPRQQRPLLKPLFKKKRRRTR